MKIDQNIPPQGTIRDWIDYRALHNPHGISHIFPLCDSTLTWLELRDIARAVAQDITAQGIGKGESVAICQPNGRLGIIILFGVLYGGFRATTLNLAAGAAAMGHAIGHSQCRLAYVCETQYDLFNAALAETVSTVKLILVKQEIPFVSDHLSVDLHLITQSDDALLMYTSGTTGLPKGVVHTHASLLAGGWTTALAHQLNGDDTALCVLPFYHINGLCVTLIGTLVSGGCCVVLPRFSTSRFWDDCDVFQVTWFSVVPTIISHLLHSKRNPSLSVIARMRFGRSASAPLSPEVQQAFEQRFSIPIIETMGLTETAAQILSNPLPPGKRKIGSPGIAYGNKVAILAHNGSLEAANRAGEVIVKGPNVMQCYLNNATATTDSFIMDGWLRTGDLGYIDEDGYVFITGRLKELIIKGGENIAPREIDEALYAHSDVVEAAAFPRSCEIYGQRVEAAVILSENSTATSQDLYELCQRRLGKFKAPDHIYILSDLPKGASGKIQRMKIPELIDAV